MGSPIARKVTFPRNEMLTRYFRLLWEERASTRENTSVNPLTIGLLRSLPWLEPIMVYILIGDVRTEYFLGSYLCKTPGTGFCSPINGLYCSSEFLNDINNRNETVGRFRYTLATNTDEVTGFFTPCGYKAHELPGATEILVKWRQKYTTMKKF